MSEPWIQRAVLHLVVRQGYGRLRRMGQRFLLPRRMVLSLLALLLTAVWIGNAAMTIWLREPASPRLLRVLVSLGFSCYAIWHLAKTACFRPEESLEWIPAERELLTACPLRPRDLLAYKLASVATTTLLKATFLTLLLLPDLPNLPVALAGIVLGMFLLELLRMGVEIATWGMSRRAFLAFRTAVVAGLLVLGWTIAATVIHSPLFSRGVPSTAALMGSMGELLIELDGSATGLINWPFSPFVNIICASGSPTVIAMWSLLAIGIVLFAGAAIFWLFAAMPIQVARREKDAYRPADTTTLATGAPASEIRAVHAIGRLGATGAIAWRQLLGTRRHTGSLLTALVIPGMLALAPTFLLLESRGAFLATAGALAFYTFLLLPTALRFDFRRDLDRLAMLKSLPIPARAMAVGQIATPVLISTLFQAVVLAVAAAIHGESPLFYTGTVLVLVPMNVLVFALDNLIYLLYPYRMEQEGLEIFLRTMLTFTGKGLLFAMGLGLVSAWGLGAALVAQSLATYTGIRADAYVIFSAGLVQGMSLISIGLVLALQRAYCRLNPIEDLPR